MPASLPCKERSALPLQPFQNPIQLILIRCVTGENPYWQTNQKYCCIFYPDPPKTFLEIISCKHLSCGLLRKTRSLCARNFLQQSSLGFRISRKLSWLRAQCQPITILGICCSREDFSTFVKFLTIFFSENYHLFDPPLMILRTFLEQILIRICILPFKRNNFQFILISKMFIMIFDVQRKSMHKFWKVLEAVRSKNAF